MNESYFYLNNECHYMLHSALKASRPTLLFIHGLGDSSLSYHSYLHSTLIDHYNILIPDLLGYGKSSASSDYHFHHQVNGIEKHLAHLQEKSSVPFSNLILITHSMGAIHATLLCESSFKSSIKAFINVEGSITQYGSFIAEKMMSAAKENNFDHWFKHFKQEIIYEKARQLIAMRTYYASLSYCDPQAFLENGMEMIEMSHALTGKYTHLIGEQYAALTIPKVYCYGDSLCKETIEFLNEHQLASRYFPCQHHFLLSACVDDFVSFIHEYVMKQI